MPHPLAVLLPVRDGARTLGACLESLRRQTFPDFRVIAVDDGSRDGTREILHREASRWSGPGGPRLTLIPLDQGVGIARALVLAASEAGGAPFLARQDADDVSLPERFARQMEYMEAHPATGVLGTGVEVTASGPKTDGWLRYEAWLSSCRTPRDIARNLWVESPLPHPTVVMRRSAYDLAGGYRERGWPEDYDLWLRMNRLGIEMARLPEVLYAWADHPGRASRTDPAYGPDRFLACRAHHLARFLEGRRLIVWGAGRDGRRAARALLREGAQVDAFLDIDPRKIGRTAYGRPILSAESWLAGMRSTRGPVVSGSGSTGVRAEAESAIFDTGSPAAPPMILAAVGTAGARELIRARLNAAGCEEGEQFLCIA